MENFQIILLIIIGSGLFGGLANYHRFDDNAEFNWFAMRRSLLLGIVAAATVPLFLKVVSSDLISEADEQKWYYFVFAGFCLVAAFFSTRFLQSLGDRVISELEEVKKKTKKLEEDTEENSAKVEVLVDKSTATADDAAADDEDDDHGFTAKGGADGSPSQKTLSDREKVVRSFKKKNYGFQTIDAIAKDCQMEKEKVASIVEDMVEEKEVKEFTNKRGQNIYAWNTSK